MSTEEKPKFNTITGSDWKLSLRAARTRRTLHRILIKKQIETAHENRTKASQEMHSVQNPKKAFVLWDKQ